MWAGIVYKQIRRRKSQIRTLLSLPAVANWYPEGDHSTSSILFWCPSINMIHRPVRKSHTLPNASKPLKEQNEKWKKFRKIYLKNSVKYNTPLQRRNHRIEKLYSVAVLHVLLDEAALFPLLSPIISTTSLYNMCPSNDRTGETQHAILYVEHDR